MSDSILSTLDVGAGDCLYIESILSLAEKLLMFYDLSSELNEYWGDMFHKGNVVPRKIVIQYEKVLTGEYLNYIPIYRHPVDTCPPTHEFTPLVKKIRDRVEKLLGHKQGYFNHALIQLYPDSESHISDHSDKTLDIMRGTQIVNVSIGAVRKMKIKNKIKGIDGVRESVRISLANGSVFVMGWQTNRRFYHGINQDKRVSALKDDSELDFGEARISITFRNIATFSDGKKLYGQGAKNDHAIFCAGKENKEESQKDEELRMLKAFSAENKNSDFDWDEHYGYGFNCINFEKLNEVEYELK
jgi:alkylated DNA repair dioxygenase AlkB